MQKVRKVMEISKQYLMEGEVNVDEFVVGGKEENKQGRSYDTIKLKAIIAIELKDR